MPGRSDYRENDQARCNFSISCRSVWVSGGCSLIDLDIRLSHQCPFIPICEVLWNPPDRKPHVKCDEVSMWSAMKCLSRHRSATCNRPFFFTKHVAAEHESMCFTMKSWFLTIKRLLLRWLLFGLAWVEEMVDQNINVWKPTVPCSTNTRRWKNSIQIKAAQKNQIEWHNRPSLS